MISFFQSVAKACSENLFLLPFHQSTQTFDDQELTKFVNRFLDSTESEQERIARSIEHPDNSLKRITQQLKEKNPELFASLFPRIDQAANRLFASSAANQAPLSDHSSSNTAEETKAGLLRSHGNSVQDPICIEDDSNAGSATLSIPPGSRIPPPHGGIGNTQNTCYAAALVHALESLEVCHFDNSPIGKAFSSLIERLKKTGPESPLEASHINALIETLTEHDWPKKLGKFGDPQELLYFLQPHLCGKQEWTVHNRGRAASSQDQACVEQMIRYVPEGTSLQEILSGTFSGASKQFEISPDGKPDYFVLTLSGREPGLSKEAGSHKDPDNRRIALSPRVFLPHKGHENQEFRLSSVVMHQPSHYYLLKPRYDDSCNLTDWVCFNDSIASIQPNSPHATSLVEQRGYMFFYRRKELHSAKP